MSWVQGQAMRVQTVSATSQSIAANSAANISLKPDVPDGWTVAAAWVSENTHATYMIPTLINADRGWVFVKNTSGAANTVTISVTYLIVHTG